MAQPRRNLNAVPDPESEAGGKGGGGGGNGFESRLTALETHFQYLATKEDIQKLKVWCLSGVVAGMGLAAAITIAILKLFSDPSP